MKNLRAYINLVILMFTLQGFTQNNVFLDRAFWDTKPDVETIKVKIKEGHNPAEANSNNFDAVVYATLQNAPLKSIEYLISQKGNPVNKLTHDGRTYIFWAAYKGNTQLMKYLLKHGAKTNLTDDKGNTIINFAASSGQQNTEVYDLCLENGADLQKDLNPDGANALLLAAPFDSDLKLISYFQSKGLDLNSTDNSGNTVFNYVAKTGNISLMNALLEKGIKGNNNAFVFAAYGTRGKTNGIEVYNYLEGLGLDPNTTNAEGTTPLHVLASRSKDVELLSYLLKKGLDVNQPNNEGNTPFMNAAASNDLNVVKLLFEGLKDINHTNKKGQSALALAISRNDAAVVEFLLKNGANTQSIDREGNYLNYYLVQSYSERTKDNFYKIMNLLKKGDVNLEAIQKNGNTWYHLAVEKQSLELLKVASEMNADINAKNKEGNTALHIAAMKAKDESVLKFLLELGAKKDMVTDFEESAYDLAQENELLTKNKISIEFLK